MDKVRQLARRMKHQKVHLSIFIILPVLIASFDDAVDNTKKLPTVFIAILVRNKAHILPYFLTLLTKIDYSKDRMFIWIRSDHNVDNSSAILETWASNFYSHYHGIDLLINNTTSNYEDSRTPSSWPISRYQQLIKLRQEALDIARRAWSDFIWFLDCDSLITDTSALQRLIQKDKTIVAPMLISTSMYSNFWGGMTSTFYYKRTEEYVEILNHQKVGCFVVPMVHSATLVNLKNAVSDTLTFLPNKISGYSGPIDDIIAFAVGANKSGIPLYICNDKKYGYTMVPLEEDETIEHDKNHLLDLKLQISDEFMLSTDTIFQKFLEFPAKQKYGLDEIFVINLKRRTERKERMQYCLNELGIDANFVEAIDGRTLNNAEMEKLGITLMPVYEDPYHKRPMKKGEIGCFLSHYNIWNLMLKKNLQTVIILEDDVRFDKSFLTKLQELMVEIDHFSNFWDLVYLGRKIMDPKQESFLEKSNLLVYPYYTYWTIGYILNQNGARKLLHAKPLDNLIPVDEFLPIMYDKHPRNDWKEYFPQRNLKALSVSPLMIFPIKYTNQDGYVSDTEDSNIINTNIFAKTEL